MAQYISLLRRNMSEQNDEKQPPENMVDRVQNLEEEKSAVISKMVKVKHEKAILIKENKLLQRHLSLSTARVAQLNEYKTILWDSLNYFNQNEMEMKRR